MTAAIQSASQNGWPARGSYLKPTQTRKPELTVYAGGGAVAERMEHRPRNALVSGTVCLFVCVFVCGALRKEPTHAVRTAAAEGTLALLHAEDGEYPCEYP
jgi:hypothetical protein